MKKESSYLFLNVFILGAVLIITSCLIFSIGNFKTEKASAQSSSGDMHGFAWSSSIGWISFNGSDEGVSGNYKVTIDEQSGYLSGYAWSSNIGWVKFGGLSGFPTTGNGTVQDNARLTEDGLTGWARVCAGTVSGNCTGASRTDGWDGWISLSGVADDGVRYGVVREGNRLVEFAWGGLLGWISFTNDYTIPLPDPVDPDDPDHQDGPGEVCTGVCFGGSSETTKELNVYTRTLVNGSYALISGVTVTSPYGSGETDANGMYSIVRSNSLTGSISVPATYSVSSEEEYVFESWEGCDSESGTNCNITVTASSANLYANYINTVVTPEPSLSVNLRANQREALITVTRGTIVTIAWQITGKGTATCNLQKLGEAGYSIILPGINKNDSWVTEPLTAGEKYKVTCTRDSQIVSDTVEIRVSNPGEV